jgi:predicted 2-oxoglutarate/Fe(II)-dependent dioxygenase YbiX
MIIEIPNYIDEDMVSYIKETVNPHVPKNLNYAYNRDGKTVNISNTPDLKDLDCKLANIFSSIQREIVELRYRPMFSSGDSGYEYHLYKPGDICIIHADGEVPFNNETNSLIRYASVILHLTTIDEGGELIFPNQNKKIKTEAGKVVVFPPYGMYQHYTTPSVLPREVIVTWFIYNNLTVLKNKG